MVNRNKINWFFWLLFTTTAELAKVHRSKCTNQWCWNLSPLQFMHLFCIWIYFKNLYGYTHLHFIHPNLKAIFEIHLNALASILCAQNHNLCIQIDALAQILCMQGCPECIIPSYRYAQGSRRGSGPKN